MKRPTASKLDLLMVCAHSLEHDWDDVPGRAAVCGTAFHSLAAFGEHDEELTPAETKALEKRHQGWLKHGAPLIPDDCRFETAYALTPEGEIRFLGENIGRDYDGRGAGPADICGSLDVQGEAVVDDWKTGKPRVSAEESWQLRFAAVVAEVPRAEFHYVSEAGRVKVDAVDYEPGELHAHYEQLVDLAIRVRDGKTPPVYGPHCDEGFCPARKTCSRYREIMGALVDAPPAKVQKRERKSTMGKDKFTLESVTTGRKRAPYYIVLYAPEGIGKSTFAAGAPSPIFIGEPGGTDHLDVARFPSPTSLDDIHDALDTLENESHDFRTLVIDTADYLEPVIWSTICEKEKKPSIESLGFGKGYVLALDEWRKLARRFDVLRREKEMNVIILAHSHLKSVRNPLGDDYEHYELKLNGKAAAFLKEAPNAVLFANYVSYTEVDENTKRAKAYGDGSRLIYTEHRPAYDAKNRYGLPAELPLNWDDFDAAARAGEPQAASKLVEEIEALIPEVDADTQDKAKAYLDANRTDTTKLSQLADRLRGKIHGQRAA